MVLLGTAWRSVFYIRSGGLGLIVLHVHVYCVMLVGTGESRVVTNPVVLD